MLTARWIRPVRIGDAWIVSPLEAHNFMMTEWPNSKSLKFAAAHLSILAALDGRQSPEDARGQFVNALKDAKLDYRAGLQ
ncbi:DUF982 domain-containing protein [Neorhizobium alkalisoli]|uniref:DUF982 domain-containing protein n=1 Tax=Neorhizobium alkalisoli TaxID=528178 RepID=UPI000CF9EEC5|nr:DUF982 domain-containing protein [Neorhizobium alkalisoli]